MPSSPDASFACVARVTYDIGRTHCPTIFWGLMTTLTLLSAFLIVLGILVLNAFEISFGGAQDALVNASSRPLS